MTSNYEWLGFGLVLAVGAFSFFQLSRRPSFEPFAKLVMLGFLLRVVGSLARHLVIFDFYNGVGDAARYFWAGREIAREIWSLDFSFVERIQATGGRLWGTPFLDLAAGVVQSVTGPTVRGEFLFFSLLSYLGLLLMGMRFTQGRSVRQSRRFFVLICFWPSLWFWPSSIGKEALVLLATGLVVHGYGGRRARIRWVALGAGLSLALVIRPHYAMVIAVCLAAAYWLALGRRWTLKTTLQAVATGVIAVWILGQSLALLGLADADLEGIREFVEYRADLTERGGSSIGSAAELGLWSIPMAFINILFRPFVWEAHNVFAAISALEVLALWVVVWRRRRSLPVLVKNWRGDRLVRFALPLTLAYILMIGLAFGNLGIISRQRVVVLPFLFLLLEAFPREARARARLRGPLRAGPHPPHGRSPSGRERLDPAFRGLARPSPEP